MPTAQETVLEIDLQALRHNFEYLKSKLESSTKFMAVVKAYAYGSDAAEIAKYLEGLKVDYFAVAFVEEGVALRKAGVKTPILVLHPQPINFTQIIRHCLEPNLYNARVLEAFIKEAEAQQQKNYPVHIKFNTGLNRLGFVEKDIDYIIGQLEKTTTVKVASIFSHLAASEDHTEKAYTLGQIAAFKHIINSFKKQLVYPIWAHQLNTSGILNYPEAQLDMVRAGIGLYGYGNDPQFDKYLKPIATLKSVISQIHTIEAGESVGYNRAFQAMTSMKTATIPIGHADGISRQLGNGKGFVTVNGQKAAIVGNVCMDMIMIDISQIDCKEGDELIVFGKENSLIELADSVNTLTYEMLTSLSQRIKRTFLR
jgi:alanine racemase